jgi:hypothetical protein
MRITSAGDVGIGTSGAVSTRLHVNGNSGIIVGDTSLTSSQVNIGVGLLTAGRPFVGTNDNTNPLEVGTRAAMAAVFVTNSTERMRITSAGLVGIGTTTPQRILGIGGTTSAYMNFNPTSHRQFTVGSDANGFIIFDDVTAFYRQVIDTSGNVGFNVNAPSYSMEVRADAASSSRYIGITNTTATGGSGAAGYLARAGSNFAYFYVRGDGTAYIDNATANPLGFATNGLERMRITSAGDVGIGTSSPGAKLGIVGGATQRKLSLQGSAFTDTTADIYIGRTGTSSAGIAQGPSIQLSNDTDSSGVILQGSNVFQIWTNNAGAGWIERMRINASDGNVGIGTNTPAYKLHVATGATGVIANFTDGIAQTLQVTTGSGWAGLNNANSGAITFGNNTERMRIDSAGNVGIGVTPSAWNASSRSLEIGNTGALTRGGNSELDLAWNAFVNAAGQYAYRTNAEASLYSQLAGAHIWSNTPTTGTAGSTFTFNERMRITPAGDVGIGTSAPTTKLEITGSTEQTLRITSLIDGSAVTPRASMLSFRSGSTPSETARISSFNRFANFNGGNLEFSTSDTSNVLQTRMTITSAGNVGIGTSNPSVQFVVSNAGAAGYEINSTGGVGGGATVSTYNRTSALYITRTTYSSAHTWYVGTAGTTRAMDLTSAGELLVGTTAAQTGVAGDPVGITLYSATSTGAAVFTRDSVNSVLYVNNKTSSGQLVQFYNGGNQVGSITSNGTTTSYVTTSDIRLKENIANADSASVLIDAIKVRQFDWKSNGLHQRYGFVAQELQEVVPEAVSQPADPDEMMGVDYSKLVPMLVKEIQSLRARVAQLEERK